MVDELKKAAKKTFKREVAIALLVWALGAQAVALWFLIQAEQWEHVVDMAQAYGLWTFGFATAAFGMDWMGKRKEKSDDFE